jgi:protein phosphatase
MAPQVIPDPSLVLLVGAAGSGKSTLAARLFAANEIVSSDALRAVVAGDEADQRASAVAFRILHRTLDRRLPSGLLTVVDATNTVAAHRRPLVRRAIIAGFPLVAIVLDLPRDVVHAQNAGRGRIVDADVVDRHLASIRAMVDGRHLQLEGFDPVVVLRSQAEAASLTIERRRTPVVPVVPVVPVPEG